MSIYNIYCDESCHLEHDNQPVMLLGAIICSESEVKKISKNIMDLKLKHRATGELKWVKVSQSRIQYYQELIDYFFSESNLRFRGLIVSDKSKLEHNYFNAGSHDSFYYKMYYYLLEILIEQSNQYNIYLDVKDTRSRFKVQNLREVLCNKKRDFERKLIPKIQSIRSNESNILQLTDFLLGAVSYSNRPEVNRSKAKLECVERIQQFCRCFLVESTPPWEHKFNLFKFTPREVR